MNLLRLCSVLQSPSNNTLPISSSSSQLYQPCAMLYTQRAAALASDKHNLHVFTSGLKILRLARPLDYCIPETRSFKSGALDESSSGETEIGEPDQVVEEGLVCGSPIVIVEAPPMLKTAEPMPMMRPNRGLIKPGDAGRVLDRRPKDVWAVRFAVGAYLIDRKYFEPYNLKE